MEVLFDDDDFQKTRRNLLVLSSAVLIFNVFSDRLEKISLLGTEIPTSSSHGEIWAILLVVALYFFIRYLQLVGFSAIFSDERYLLWKEAILARIVIFLKRSEIDAEVLEFLAKEEIRLIASTITWKAPVCIPTRLNYLPLESGNKHEGYYREQHYVERLSLMEFMATITISGREEGTDDLVSSSLNKTFTPPRLIKYASGFISFVLACLLTRWATDFLLPLVIALYAVSIAFARGACYLHLLV